MGVNPANQLRITGMATGLDTDEYVKKMTLAQQAKIDKANQDKQFTTWKQEAYVDVIKDLKTLTNDYLTMSGSKSIVKSSAYVGSKVTSDNESVATATALAGAVNGNYKINVTQLAKSASIKSDALKTTEGTASKSTVLSDLSGVVLGDDPFKVKLSVKIDGKMVDSHDISIGKTDKIEDVMDNINNTTITLTSDDGKTTDKLLKDYVKVSFSELTGKLTIETRETGKDSQLEITDTASKDFANLFGINDGDLVNQSGLEAVVKITPPGETIATTVIKHTNSFTIDGITYNPKEVGDATLTVKADASESVEKISDFIKEYNKIVAKVNEKLKEKKSYDYKPLTEAQKKDMKEDEIKTWEEKAKKGLLKNDNNLENMLSAMRRSFFDGVTDAGLNLSDLGLSTSRDTQNKSGQIVFVDSNGYENEAVGKEKLKNALETNGDQVMEFFNKSASSTYSSTMSLTERETRYSQQGVFQKIKDILQDYTGVDGALVKKAGYENSRWVINNDLSKKIEDQNKQIKELTRKLYTKQDYYYKMFSKLETAMNQMNSQQDWLASQMGQ
ncbi:flagellar filament capping protein FliD [Clostridium aestuarii]|uniref:Flagellar hook-associated protein 2 n=1 Tax=Clostridium aestuarii TaxID=338193 RepID=A0ABT4CXD7_9CLOT|nr:flagellar filament capping protein FliD [Clostridium aestuarii]MCY6483662.1 flagellar filament capping protein FliD [Clostridium aestuarii]